MDAKYEVTVHGLAIIAALESLESGGTNRLLIEMPPQHGKTLHASQLFPSWYLGRHPGDRVITASYSLERAQANSYEVRALICDEKYPFPGVQLSADSTAVDHWRLTTGAEFLATGVGGSMTGFGAELMVIDDALKDRADADSPTRREQVWKWYTDVARTRLHKESRQLVMMCMAGDTPVRMGDGTERRLDAIRVGDIVATYDRGFESSSCVLGWKDQGLDAVYEMRMASGSCVRANARHPFLVDRGGCLGWVKLRSLRLGDRVVASRRSVEGRRVIASGDVRPNTRSAFGVDEVVSIVSAGSEHVYDVQIERTENFIANGLVSHNTRWHDDDLVGRILNSPGADKWSVLRVPALAEENDPLGRAPGEALWPARYDVEYLTEQRDVLGSRSFESLYQQKPVPDGGVIFRADWFKAEYAELPSGLFRCMVVDSAWKTGSSNDYSVIAHWATDFVNYYVVDIVRGRWEYPDLRQRVVAEYWKHGAKAIFVEDTAAGIGLIQELRSGTGLPIVSVKAGNDRKEAKAERVTPFFEAGKVFLPKDAPWKACWLDEHLRFPGVPHDDQVDTTQIALRKLSERAAARSRPDYSHYRGFMAR
jgi:predicted phage terminase large subunit-like protein